VWLPPSKLTCSASLEFEIPPDCILPDPCSPSFLFKTGTVAGTVPITGAVTPGAQKPEIEGLSPPAIAFPTRTLQQDPVPPHIDKDRVSVRLGSGGFDVCIPGFTNTRQMDNVRFRFVAAQGKTITFDPSPQPMGDAFATWFSLPSSANEGGFMLLLPLAVQGDSSAVRQLYFSFTNSAGASEEAGPYDLAGAPRCLVQF
jgi:hypothetical protein